MRNLGSEMSQPNVWRSLRLGQADGVTKITSTIMRKEAERVMTVRKQEKSKHINPTLQPFIF
jgi:hypothetical protein